MWQEFLGWYLAPWRRMNRMTFNVVVGMAMIPGILFSFTGLLDGAGGVLGPAMDLMGGGGTSSAPVSGAGPEGLPPGLADQLAKVKGNDGHGMSDAEVTRAVSEMMPHGPMANVPGTGQASGFSWGMLVGDLIMLALVPLVMMRLRDMGQRGMVMWILLGGAYASIAVDFAGMVGLDLGMLGIGAGVVGMFLWLWLSMAPTSRPERSRLLEGALLEAGRSGDPLGPADLDDRRMEMPDERRW